MKRPRSGICPTITCLGIGICLSRLIWWAGGDRAIVLFLGSGLMFLLMIRLTIIVHDHKHKDDP